MRSALILAACSLFALVACTKTVLVAPAPTTPPEETGEDVDAGVVDPTPNPEVSAVLDLGEVESGKDVSFEIPAGALGFNISFEAAIADFDPEAPFGIERITDPSGKVLHDQFRPKSGGSSSNPTSIATFDAIAAASIPQGDGAPQDLSGSWKVRLGVFGAGGKVKAKGRVHVQSSGDGQFHGGMLDVVLHVPSGLVIGDHVVDASKASSDSEIKDRLDTFFFATKELLGIERGEVKFEAETNMYRELNDNEVLQGFAISAGQKDGTQALHILMTNLLAQNGEPFAAGISPGIPGAATVFGRNVSGIIVTTSESPDQDAFTMLHEAGHFFGLNHTSEFDGESSDPLADTPSCAGTISMDNPNSFFECDDRKNVMFPAGPIDGPVTLSAGQQRVYRGSPIYRAMTAGGGSNMSRPVVVGSRPMPSPRFRFSGSKVLGSVERELAAGFCGLNKIDAAGMVERHGRAKTIAELQKAAADSDLRPYIRGRARLALASLGAK
jgi:hypothetical protein